MGTTGEAGKTDGGALFEVIRNNWERILKKVCARKPVAEAYLKEGRLLKVDGAELTIGIDRSLTFHIKNLREPGKKKIIEDSIAEVTGMRLSMVIQEMENSEDKTKQSSSSASTADTRESAPITKQPKRVCLSLDELGPYMEKHKLRLVSIVDKTGKVWGPEPPPLRRNDSKAVHASVNSRVEALLRDEFCRQLAEAELPWKTEWNGRIDAIMEEQIAELRRNHPEYDLDADPGDVWGRMADSLPPKPAGCLYSAEQFEQAFCAAMEKYAQEKVVEAMNQNYVDDAVSEELKAWDDFARSHREYDWENDPEAIAAETFIYRTDIMNADPQTAAPVIWQSAYDRVMANRLAKAQEAEKCEAQRESDKVAAAMMAEERQIRDAVEKAPYEREAKRNRIWADRCEAALCILIAIGLLAGLLGSFVHFAQDNHYGPYLSSAAIQRVHDACLRVFWMSVVATICGSLIWKHFAGEAPWQIPVNPHVQNCGWRQRWADWFQFVYATIWLSLWPAGFYIVGWAVDGLLPGWADNGWKELVIIILYGVTFVGYGVVLICFFGLTCSWVERWTNNDPGKPACVPVLLTGNAEKDK